MKVISGDARVLLGYLIESTCPERTRVHKHIVLMNKSHMLARATCCTFKRITNYSLGAPAGIKTLLGGYFIRSSLRQETTGTHIRTFSAFAHHHEIEFFHTRKR